MRLKRWLWNTLVFCHTIVQKFLGRSEWKRDRSVGMLETHGTDGCRVFWTALGLVAAVVTNVATYGFLLYVVTWAPVKLFGLKLVIGTVLAIAAIVGIVAGTIYLLARNEEKVEAFEERVTTSVRSAAVAVNSRVHVTGFFSAMWQLYLAAKRGLCPKILPPQPQATE